MEGVITSAPQEEIKLMPIVDVRDTPLGCLPEDADVRRMVTGVVQSMEGPSRVRVAMFSSAV